MRSLRVTKNLLLLCVIAQAIALILTIAPACLAADFQGALTKKEIRNQYQTDSKQKKTELSNFKIVSYAPSNTELLYSIHADNELIGTCTYCDFPLAVEEKENSVRLSPANIERLSRLKPDSVVLVSGQESLSGMLMHNGFHVRLLQNTKLSDIGDNLRALGALTSHEKNAQELATTLPTR